MKDMLSRGLKLKAGKLLVLDQQRLPDDEAWIESESPETMVRLIRGLHVRGAPLIGVAAALALAKHVETIGLGGPGREIARAAALLRESRPTAVNLMSAIDRLMKAWRDAGESHDALIAEAESVFDEDVALCGRIANNGASLINDGDAVLTHCNAGALATAGVGTAVGVITRAFELGKRIHVFVDETRPLLQGGRLTAWELTKAGIPFTLICDNMAAGLMAQRKIQKVIVGADRIATNGDFANKIGTYGVAVLAHHHRIPFYVAAPYTTIDRACHSGAEIPIEHRHSAEVRGASGHFGEVRWAPEGCDTYNPAFDVTPGELVEAFILDTGVYRRADVQRGKLSAAKEGSR